MEIFHCRPPSPPPANWPSDWASEPQASIAHFHPKWDGSHQARVGHFHPKRDGSRQGSIAHVVDVSRRRAESSPHSTIGGCVAPLPAHLPGHPGRKAASIRAPTDAQNVIRYAASNPFIV